MFFSTKFIQANSELCEFDHPVPAPYFRKKFDLDFIPEKAEITICGLGFYELYLNGREITKCPLAPYISNPDEVCYYDTYDVKNLLNQGENIIGVLLGNGMRNAFGGFVWDFDKSDARGPVTLALGFEAENGEKCLTFEADRGFVTAPSPILFNDLRMGYEYDARLEIPGWNTVGFDDEKWTPAEPAKTPAGIKKLCTATPVTVAERLKPISVKRFDLLPYGYTSASQDAKPIESAVCKNVTVYDFGANKAGVTMLKINGRPGQKIVIRHAEHLIRGNYSEDTILFREDGRHEVYLKFGQTDTFICKGGEETFIPKFKYDGFRYAYVVGLDEDQATDDALTYLVLNGDFRSRAGFQCSNETLNRLYACARNSDLSNFQWFPTDCPHREKNGWTGDANMSAEHMLLNFDMKASLKEWLTNIRAVQNEEGNLPGIVPTGGWGFAWGNGAAWDLVCIGLPYYIYKFDGDTEVIRENAHTMLRYLHYAVTHRDADGLVANGLGDWVDPYLWEKGGISAPVTVTNTALVYDYANRAAFLFGEIGDEFARDFAIHVARELRQKFRAKLIDFSSMTVAGDCQSSQAVAIGCGLFDENEIPEAMARLIGIIDRNDGENACGMIGLRYIFHLLAEKGYADLAYRMIVSEKRTGYGYWIKNGATALWESFADANGEVQSQNHHFLGDISSWMIQCVAGIRPNPKMTDPTEFEIRPHFIEDLDFASAFFESAKGRVSAEWTRKGNSVELTVECPNGIHGRIVVADGWKTTASTDELTAGKKTYCFTKE